MEIPIFKCRASCGGKIMTDAKGKSNLEIYNDAVETLEKKKTQLLGFKNQECKTAVSIRTEQIPKLEKLIPELEKLKSKVKLSETTIQYLREWIIERKYGRRKEFTTKHTVKGNTTEQDGFKLIQDVVFDGKVFMSKSKSFYEDEYFTGNLDLDLPTWVLDNKSSWNIFTFPIGETEPPDKANEPQIRIYMRLAKKEKGSVCYTLNNTPLKLIEDECWKYARANNIKDIEDIPEEISYEICKNHAFTTDFMRELSFIYGTFKGDFIEIPKEKRLVKFDYVRDLEIEQKIIDRVLVCREWVNENWIKF